MTSIRIIARLDVKAPNLIKGVHLEGLRKLGDPQTFAEKYYNEGIDEIMKTVKALRIKERLSKAANGAAPMALAEVKLIGEGAGM